MVKTLAVLAVALAAISWIAALAAGGYVEYLGWREVIANHHVASGLATAVFGAPIVLMTVQTVLGLVAAPVGMLAERLDDSDGKDLATG